MYIIRITVNMTVNLERKMKNNRNILLRDAGKKQNETQYKNQNEKQKEENIMRKRIQGGINQKEVENEEENEHLTTKYTLKCRYKNNSIKQTERVTTKNTGKYESRFYSDNCRHKTDNRV